jgi:hypothetical protein
MRRDKEMEKVKSEKYRLKRKKKFQLEKRKHSN